MLFSHLGYFLYALYGDILTGTLLLTVTHRLFTGQRWDATIGLYEHQGKFYDPLLGQFVQPPEHQSLPVATSHGVTPNALAMTDQARETPSRFEYLLGETWANKAAGEVVGAVVDILPKEIFKHVSLHPSTIESSKLRGVEPPYRELVSYDNPWRSDFMKGVYGIGLDIGWQALADLGTEMPLDERLARAVFGSGAGGLLGGKFTNWSAIHILGIANPGFLVTLFSGYVVEPIVGDMLMYFFYNARGYSDIE